MESKPQVVALVTSILSTTEQESHHRGLDSLFEAKKLTVEKIDGSLEENRELRNKLFEISGQRAKYPQVFVRENSEYRFVGTFPDIQELNENSHIPKELLDANPQIPTFDKVFEKCF